MEVVMMSKGANGTGTVYKPKHPSKNLPFRAEVWVTDMTRPNGKKRISKNFKKKAKTVTIKKNATVAKTVTGLRSGKKCYMKIRAYKTVDGRKLYGKCSKTLSIKCK